MWNDKAEKDSSMAPMIKSYSLRKTVKEKKKPISDLASTFGELEKEKIQFNVHLWCFLK